MEGGRWQAARSGAWAKVLSIENGLPNGINWCCFSASHSYHTKQLNPCMANLMH